MPKVRIEAGATIDFLSRAELKDDLHHANSALLLELARGLKSIRLPSLIIAPVGGAITVGGDAPNQPQYGPRPGFVWNVKRISVYGDQTVDTISVYRGDPAIAANFVCRIPTSTGIATFGKGALVLFDSENLAFVGAGLTSSVIAIGGDVTEAPGPEIYKLIN